MSFSVERFVINTATAFRGSLSGLVGGTSRVSTAPGTEAKLNLNGDFNLQKSDNSNIKGSNRMNKENAEINAKLQERVQNVFSRHDVDFTDLLWEILMSE